MDRIKSHPFRMAIVFFLVLAVLQITLPPQTTSGVEIGAENQLAQRHTMTMQKDHMSEDLPPTMKTGDLLEIRIWLNSKELQQESISFVPTGSSGSWQWIGQRYLQVPDLPPPVGTIGAEPEGAWVTLTFKLIGKPTNLQIRPATRVVSDSVSQSNALQTYTARGAGEERDVTALRLEQDPQATAVLGTRKPAAILIDFPDVSGSHTQQWFQSALFGNNTNPGTLSSYYAAQSFGKLSVQGKVASDWATASHFRAYYNSSWNAQREMILEALYQVDPYVDFSQYDGDGDGDVDGLIIAYAGDCPWAWADPLWPHMGYLNPPVYMDGVWLDEYFLTSEYDNNGIFPIGAYAHEYCHLIGGRDLYDYDKSSYGVGSWSLMCTPQSTTTQPYLDPWARIDFGWITPTTVSFNQHISLQPVESFPQIIKIPLPNSNEYFLLENRRKSGFDQSLPGSGLLIWHIDQNVMLSSYHPNDNEWYPGRTNSGHYGAALEQADGLWGLEKRQNFGDPSDPFLSGKSFTPATSPNSSCYDGSSNNLSVFNIRNSGVNIDFDIMFSSSSSITVVSPNGGEAWPINSSQTIRWTSSGVSGNVKIELSRNGGQQWQALFSSTANDGNQPWTVTSPAANQCLVRVTSVNSPQISDTSDGFFTIGSVAPPTVDLIYDDGSAENYYASEYAFHGFATRMTPPAGDQALAKVSFLFEPFPDIAAFQWEVWDCTGALGSPGRRLAGPFNASADPYGNWSVIDSTSLGIRVNGDFYVACLQQNAYPSPMLGVDFDLPYYDRSYEFWNGEWYYWNEGDESWPGKFMIRAQVAPNSNPYILVQAPNGGESWPVGTTQTIGWSSGSVLGNVKIELSRNGGSSWSTLLSSTPNDGAQNWTVSGNSSKTCLIRISSVNSPTVKDQSDLPFTIGKLPSVTTKNATSIGGTIATLNGSAVPNSQATVVWFQWGDTQYLGYATPQVSIGSGVSTVSFSSKLTNLLRLHTYYFRAVAMNASGTVYGQIFTFKTK